jgi:hypothetical protein
LENVSRQWARSDAEAALSWAESLPDAASRDAVLPNILSVIGETDLRQATQMFSRLSPTAQESAVGTIASRWADEDPQAASRWAATLPEGRVRERAVNDVIGRWAEIDPYNAASWLSTLSQGSSRDSAVAIYAGRIASSDPQTAVEWAETIGNEKARNSQIESIVRSWLDTDASAAKMWLAVSSLPEEIKARLLSQR